MYVTKPLSLYKNFPDSLSDPPPEGPNSGYLVVQDEESIETSCFGFCKRNTIEDLPLPSNKVLNIDYGSDDDDEIFTIPVINQPLSASRYYAIKARSRHKGEACASSREEEKAVCCGGSYSQDAKSRPLDPNDIYQQFKFDTTTTCTNSPAFLARSVASDGYPPRFLSSFLGINTSVRTTDFIQGEATGLNSSLRDRLPNFNFPLSQEFSEPICVGKWLCPFMFINDGKLEEQVKKSVYYDIRLEQLWENIFTSENSYIQGNKVILDVVVPTEVVRIARKVAVRDEMNNDNNKVVWFRSMEGMGEEISVGLSELVLERMVWEQEKFGWVNGEEKQVRVFREEEYGGVGLWVRFGCYVLVERYVVKRMDGSLVMTYDFKHTHQIRIKWE